MGTMRNAYIFLSGNYKEKTFWATSLQDNIKMGLKEICCECVYCINWLRLGSIY
jgi:hypothetical protein